MSLIRGLAASVVTGFSVALVVHLIVVMTYFLTNGAKPELLTSVSDFFLPASVAFFILASVAAALRAARFWFTAAAAGVVASAIATFLGAGLGLVPAGTAWTQEILQILAASLVGTNLVYLVAAAIVFPTFGRQIWNRMVRATSSAVRVPRMLALVRPPSTRLAEGQVTHIERTPVDFGRADDQWEAYVAALEEHGFTAVEVPVADDMPDSVFIEDTVVVFGGVAVVARPGADTRQGETAAVEQSVRELGFRVHHIDEPGTLDGGDVLTIGMTVYVGRGSRTNADGIRQLREIIAPLGYTVVAVPLSKALHLKSAVSALPDGTVIGNADVVDHPGLFPRFLELPEREGAAVVVLGPDAVLMSASAPQSAALLADLGYRVVTVDVSEFEKLEGGVTCLSVRIR